jgi:drug/metabolite transporter (DMT)-like permease
MRDAALAALAGAAFGALAVAVRGGLRQGVQPALGAIAATAVALVVSTALTALSGVSAPDMATLWPFVAVGALAPGASQILLTLAVENAGPARAAVYMGASPLLSILLALILLNERFQPPLVVGAVLIVLGGVTLAAERARPAHFRARGVALAIVCAGLFAGRDNLLRLAARDNRPPPLPAATATLTGALAFLLVCGFLSSRAHPRGLPRALRAFAPAGIALGLGYDALLSAYDRGTVSIVAPLNATGSFWAVILTVLLFGRSEMIGRRTIAAAVLIVAGGALIGVEHGSRGTERHASSTGLAALSPPRSAVGFAGAALGVPGRGSARTAVHRGAE